MMRLVLLQIILVVLWNGIAAQTNAWNGLQPLRSTRADVEAKYGKPVKDGLYIRHQYDGGSFEALYSDKPCDEGWDVPVDTLLELRIYSNEKEGKSFDELGLKKSELFVSVDDAFYATWTQPDSGRTYYFGRVDQEFGHEGYIPTQSDNNRRCDGFPPFVPEAINYLRLDEFTLNPPPRKGFNSFYDVLTRIDNLLAYRKDRSDGKDRGYVVVYFDNKLPLSRYKDRLASIKTHIFQLRNQSPEDMQVIEGGYRAESRVELYVLPRDWKPPAPNPTLPSPQFMKKRK